MAGPQYDIIIGVSVGFGTLVLILVLGKILTRTKRTHPKLSIKNVPDKSGNIRDVRSGHNPQVPRAATARNTCDSRTSVQEVEG